MSFQGLLNTTCTIQTKTVTNNATSNQAIESWASTYTLVKCRLDQNTGRVNYTQNAIYSKATHIMFMEYRTLSEKTHRIVCGGNNYTILAVINAGGVNRHLEVLLERIS